MRKLANAVRRAARGLARRVRRHYRERWLRTLRPGAPVALHIPGRVIHGRLRSLTARSAIVAVPRGWGDGLYLAPLDHLERPRGEVAHG